MEKAGGEEKEEEVAIGNAFTARAPFHP